MNSPGMRMTARGQGIVHGIVSKATICSTAIHPIRLVRFSMRDLYVHTPEVLSPTTTENDLL